MPGLWAWSDGLIVILFEFLDDDTKLAQSCRNWLYLQHWHTVDKAWRRQSSAEWASRAVTDLLDESKAWTTGWRRLRAHGDAHFKEALAEAAALHAHEELFAKHIEPEPAPEDPVDRAMAEATYGEYDAPMPDAPPEPELIDMPPAPASAPPMTNLERCIALRLVYGAGPR